MRTKTLLLTAALSAAGIASSMAQVYSVNAVGYINKTLKPGWNLLANQLTVVSAGGVTNAINSVIPVALEESQLLKFNGVTKSFERGAIYYEYGVLSDTSPAGWYNTDDSAPSVLTLNPGEGFFISNPTLADTALTFVGEVPQGDSLQVPVYGGGWNLIASVVPQEIYLATTNGVPLYDEFKYLKFNPATQGYSEDLTWYSFDPLDLGNGAAWYDTATSEVRPTPKPAVGDGFFFSNAQLGNNYTWTRSFHVN